MISGDQFKALGHKVRGPAALERFASPAAVRHVKMSCDEFTSLCPVTGQPDWSDIIIDYVPGMWCIESKSLKLYLWKYREMGCFCEELSELILNDVFACIEPSWAQVTVQQKSRGGIAIESTAVFPTDEVIAGD
jgi:7-cyano-7-deazaguanine reductase